MHKEATESENFSYFSYPVDKNSSSDSSQTQRWVRKQLQPLTQGTGTGLIEGRPGRRLATACMAFSAVAMLALRYQGHGDRTSPVTAAPVVQAELITPEQSSAYLQGDAATLFSIALLERAEEFLSQVHDYTTVFYKQERLHGELAPENQIQLKIRHQPFSAYLRWINPNAGREVIYVDGANDNRMIVHEGSDGMVGKLASFFVPVLKLDPLGDIAMSKSRHPINEIGLLNLTRKLLTVRYKELGNPTVEVQMTDTAEVDGRPCYLFQHLHPQRDGDSQYHKVVVYIDKEMRIPVSCSTYDWPSPRKPDEPVVVERYTYTQLQFNQTLSDLAFDYRNPEYGYRR